MPRIGETLTDKIIRVIKVSDDPAMLVGYRSDIYVEKNKYTVDEYFYDKYEKKCYVKNYDHLDSVEIK
ncbi:hypothetical protein GC093_29965 [Paenibacillus sp. LMG 31456]|uniref:Uncharacterized protein n=1 Tax=Paenibacillus foliorum TaxID=2654974 RepID=A0A972GZH1_9BACL|nr:hypothetical protein [Paenibacillus foliorum]NOU97424.1 hypothetical protein [Paenibacillus foliorum]